GTSCGRFLDAPGETGLVRRRGACTTWSVRLDGCLVLVKPGFCQALSVAPTSSSSPYATLRNGLKRLESSARTPGKPWRSLSRLRRHIMLSVWGAPWPIPYHPCPERVFS